MILCEGQLQAIIVGCRVDLRMKNTYVLVCSQSVIIGRKCGKELLNEIMIQSDIPVMKTKNYRPVRMIGPSIGMKITKDIVAGIVLEDYVRHIQNKFGIEIVGGCIAVKETEANARCKRRGVIEL